MTFISKQNKIKLRNKGLYLGNILMAIAISSIVFVSCMPIGGAITWLLLDDGKLTKCAELIPEFMQFIEIGSLESITSEVNLVFYASLIFAMVITAATIYMLYKAHKNSEKIGENNCESKILIIEEKQTVSYYNGEYELSDKSYVVLYKKYPNGCIVQSDSGKKVAILQYEDDEMFSEGETKNWGYKVVSYKNTKDQTITEENFLQKFRKDFFITGHTRNDVRVYSIAHDTLSKLSGVTSEVHSKEERVESSASL